MVDNRNGRRKMVAVALCGGLVWAVLIEWQVLAIWRTTARRESAVNQISRIEIKLDNLIETYRFQHPSLGTGL